jgi:hypothetical protein
MRELLSRFLDIVPAETLVTLTAVSLLVFVATLILIPFILIRLPADYFDIRTPRTWMKDHHPVLRFVGHLVKNVLGVTFLAAGFAMLVLPGQGLLTILIGISLLDFPGKQRLEARIVSQPAILNVINAIRRKCGKPALVIAPESAK